MAGRERRRRIAASRRVPPAHNGGGNMLLANGHVKWYPAGPKFALLETSEE